MLADLGSSIDLLRSQWNRLRAWIPAIVDDRRPSALDGWTVADLVAHLARALDMLTRIEPAPAGTLPVTLGEYLGQYPNRAAEVAETTRRFAAEIAVDPLAAMDAMAAESFARLEALRGVDVVVPARRAPIRLSDVVVSRLLELVVHADDLDRSVDLPGPPPIDDAALRLVADELLRIVVARGGWHLEVAEPLLWVRLACGRVTPEPGLLTRALRPAFASDGVPDLALQLPLL